MRPATATDREAMLGLNLESEWALSPLDEPGLDALVASARVALVAEDGAGVAGFALALGPEAEYESANFRWFAERFDSFLYLDRIAVGARSRRRGVGAAIYEVMECEAARSGRMCCEVNLVPRNAPSLAFHLSRGYEEVGTLEHPGGKVVVMLVKELAR
ncbi:MAG: GNAT family N-acetyltransferase [Actinomycetota bacterium]|nr:GNAT family N-acetyltransferase [Actinomycetota bacterium]